MKKYYFGKVLVFLIIIFSFVLARGGLPPKLTEKLDLTVQQQEQMKTLHEKQRVDFKNNMDKVKILHDQLDQELLKSKLDEQKIKNITEQIKIIQLKLIDAHFEQILGMRKILTQEQFKKMLDLRRDLKTKMGKKIRDNKTEAKNRSLHPPKYLP